MATTSGNGPRGPGMSHLIPLYGLAVCAETHNESGSSVGWGGHGPLSASSPECREARAGPEAQGHTDQL